MDDSSAFLLSPLQGSVCFCVFLFIHVSSCHLWAFLSCFCFLVTKLFCFYLHHTWSSFHLISIYIFVYLFIYLFCFISTFTVLVILIMCLGNNARNGSSCLHQAFIQSVGICFSSISIFGFRVKLKKYSTLHNTAKTATWLDDSLTK